MSSVRGGGGGGSTSPLYFKISNFEGLLGFLKVYGCLFYQLSKILSLSEQVLLILDKIDNKSLDDEPLPDNDEAIQVLILEQELLIGQQEENRSEILGLLQRGKDLLRDPNCPPFLKDDVAALELKWNNCCRKSLNRLNDLKDNAR